MSSDFSTPADTTRASQVLITKLQWTSLKKQDLLTRSTGDVHLLSTSSPPNSSSSYFSAPSNLRPTIHSHIVLEDTHKELIQALIRQQSARAAFFDDIVAGKGKGLIGLLSGKPGCGKTLTAEAAAELTHRPLYVVSAGELGTNPEWLDIRLKRILELAQMRDGALLLDEAEVFLQARTTADVNRIALVSIFLRQLEYYQGIMILTTNMLEQCDPAFESTFLSLMAIGSVQLTEVQGRIHFSIRYPDLDFKSRKAVWKTYFDKTLQSPDDISEEDLDRLSGYKMNGRQVCRLYSPQPWSYT
ncbi:P-loop containing nucleoside triphosphate hydrolase protein [Lyophyllum atratum]|nr:P-loop containing nucleoside triphosphate hydrolase protein [Lyophyllum atratum]